MGAHGGTRGTISFGGLFAVCLATLLGVAPPGASAQNGDFENEAGLFAGQWIGADFIERTFQTTDPFTGTVEFGSALRQGNALALGVQYIGYFSRWLAADVAVGYVSSTWTSVGGRVTGGELSGQVDEFTGVTTIPFFVNALLRLPLLSNGPTPYVSVGAGGVFYEFNRSNAPLVVNPVSGPAIDTLLFDLDLGLRLAPNGAAGVSYRFGPRLVFRAEGRLFLTFLHERLEDKFITQKNYWLTVSTGYRF